MCTMLRIFVDSSTETPASGSHAMIISTLKLLAQVFPDAELAIVSSHPEVDRKRYGSFGFNLNIVGRASGRVRTAWALLRQYFKADLIVGVYGDGFVIGANLVFLEFITKMLLATFPGKPVVILPASIGPFAKGLRSTLARWALKRVKVIAAREETTYRHLAGIGIDRSRLFLTPDMAFACPVADSEKVGVIMANHGIIRLKRPLIGMNVSQPLNFYSSQHLGSRQGYNILMAALADYVVMNLDASVVLVPYYLWPPDAGTGRDKILTVGGGFDDTTAGREVYERVQQKNRVVPIETYCCDVTELNGIIGQCDLFIGGLLHTSIAAISAGVPTITMDFRYKTPAVMKMVGLEKYYCDLRTVTFSELTGKVDDLWTNRERIRKMLEFRVEEFRTSIRSLGKSLTKLLNPPC